MSTNYVNTYTTYKEGTGRITTWLVRNGAQKIVESKKGPRGLKTSSPVKDIFQDRNVSDGLANLSTPNIVTMTAVATKAERIRPAAVTMADFCRTILVQKQYTLLQILQAVREGVASEEMHLLFDYFAMHQRGMDLMEDIRKRLHEDMVNCFGSNYLDADYQLPYVIAYIFEAMEHPDPDAGRKMLLDAAAELRQFLSGQRGSIGVVAARKLSDAAPKRGVAAKT